MIAFDADVLTLLAEGDPLCLQKASLYPATDQSVPIIVAEQVLRGRLNVIRQAQAGKSSVSLEFAYDLLQGSITDLNHFQMLRLSPQAGTLVQAWRKQKIKVGISDLRIAAICMAHSAT